MTNKRTAAKKTVRPVLELLVHNFFAHNIGKNAAALAYYLLFALFPLLIFISNLLGLLHLDVYAVIEFMQQFLPKDVTYLIGTYLEYVSHTSDHVLMWFSLVFSVWFPLRAAKGLMDDVRLAYHLGKPRAPILYGIRQILYTIVLLLVIGLTLLFSTAGKHVLNFINDILPDTVLQLSQNFLGLWQFLRFIPIALLMFAAVGTLYAISLDHRQPVKTILPGIIAALFAWLAVSAGFSFYVENFANYSVIYGTLGAVIVLMMWLYMTAVILILGAELNAALLTVRTVHLSDSLECPFTNQDTP